MISPAACPAERPRAVEFSFPTTVREQSLFPEPLPALVMSAEENKELVRRQFELMSRGDVSGAAALWATESFNHGRRTSPEGMARVFESLYSVRESHTLHEMIAEGDWVTVRTTCTGTYSVKPAIPVNGGMFDAIEPSGRSYTVQHIHMFRVRGGKLSEHWANRDDLGAARQIGLDLRPVAK